MLVSIIIVNYNTFEITCDCIGSVVACTKGVPFEIILVDNASPKDDPDEFLKRFPFIELIKSPVNGGFAKGNNLGIEKAKGDIILLLNSDTILREDSISVAARRYMSFENCGVLGVRLEYPDGKVQHTARKFRSIKGELLDLLRPVLYLMSYQKRAALMLNQYFNADFDTECEWLSGAFFMFRKSILTELNGGKLDERFFMYGEDQLWCYQISKLGYKNYFIAGTAVVHINNASTEKSKQVLLLKKFLDLELEIMRYRGISGIQYMILALMFKIKERLRFGIKLVVFNVFNKQIR